MRRRRACQPLENLLIFRLPEILILLIQIIKLILGRDPRRIVRLAHIAFDTLEMLASVVDLLLERDHVGIFVEYLFDPSKLLRIDLLPLLPAFLLSCLVLLTLYIQNRLRLDDLESVWTIPAIMF